MAMAGPPRGPNRPIMKKKHYRQLGVLTLLVCMCIVGVYYTGEIPIFRMIFIFLLLYNITSLAAFMYLMASPMHRHLLDSPDDPPDNETPEEERKRIMADPKITVHINIFKGIYKAKTKRDWAVVLAIYFMWAINIGLIIAIIFKYLIFPLFQ